MEYEKMLKVELINELLRRDGKEAQIENDLRSLLEEVSSEFCEEASPYIKQLMEILDIEVLTEYAVELQLDVKVPIYLAKTDDSDLVLNENDIYLSINGKQYPVKYFGQN